MRETGSTAPTAPTQTKSLTKTTYLNLILNDKCEVRLSSRSVYKIPYLTIKEFFEFIYLVKEVSYKSEKTLSNSKEVRGILGTTILSYSFNKLLSRIKKFLMRVHGCKWYHSKWKRDFKNYVSTLPRLTNIIIEMQRVNTSAMEDFFFLQRVEAMYPMTAGQIFSDRSMGTEGRRV